jgi:hypothetical protein
MVTLRAAASLYSLGTKHFEQIISSNPPDGFQSWYCDSHLMTEEVSERLSALSKVTQLGRGRTGR